MNLGEVCLETNDVIKMADFYIHNYVSDISYHFPLVQYS